jgi:catechol 2,3-dioxygenase-like lactoylglutathione lyase family enzyme
VSYITGVHHVQVAAPGGCEVAARAFYGGMLGLEEIVKPPLLASRGGCWFRAGAGEVHIGVDDPFTPAARAHPALSVESVAALDRLATALVEAGIEVRWADDAEIPAQRRFHVSDPWGNRLEIVAARRS